MKEQYTQTHILKPTWSRFMHKMHRLGRVYQEYSNSLATISTLGEYPRLIPSYDESRMSSLDDGNTWHLDTWQKGIIQTNPRLRRASISFYSATGEIFYNIKTTTPNQWDCLQCLIKLFSSSTIQHTPLHDQCSATTEKNQINQVISTISKEVNRQIISGKHIQYSLLLADGSTSIHRQPTRGLMTMYGNIALANDTRLQIKPHEVDDVKIIKNRHTFSAEVFNTNSEKLLTLSTA